jgi:hypothetical protein
VACCADPARLTDVLREPVPGGRHSSRALRRIVEAVRESSAHAIVAVEAEVERHRLGEDSGGDQRRERKRGPVGLEADALGELAAEAENQQPAST